MIRTENENTSFRLLRYVSMEIKYNLATVTPNWDDTACEIALSSSHLYIYRM